KPSRIGDAIARESCYRILVPLTAENYSRGFLVDHELMAGVTESAESPGGFLAFVVRYATGEYLGQNAYEDLSPALQAINQIPRAWEFEATNGCGGNCGTGAGEGAGSARGGCRGGNCSACRASGQSCVRRSERARS